MILFFTNLWLKLEFIGFSIIEALVFYFTFNYLAPFVHENLLELPITHLPYFICLSIFIMIHFIGVFIGKLTPKLFSIKTEAKTEK